MHRCFTISAIAHVCADDKFAITNPCLGRCKLWKIPAWPVHKSPQKYTTTQNKNAALQKTQQIQHAIPQRPSKHRRFILPTLTTHGNPVFRKCAGLILGARSLRLKPFSVRLKPKCSRNSEVWNDCRRGVEKSTYTQRGNQFSREI